MGFKMKYAITTNYIPTGTKRRSGIKMVGGKPNFGVLHDTGNESSTADANVRYYINSRNEMSASAHTFIDDKAIIECIPLTTGTPEKAWHVLYNVTTDNNLFGADANDKAAGVELCFGGKINFAEAYKRYVWYNAYLAYKFGFSPTRFVGHHILDPGRKSDPVNALKRYGKTYEQLLKDIVTEYNECSGTTSTTPQPSPPVTATNGTHTIAKGDTLWSLSQKYKTTVDRLIAINPGINPNALKVGDVIKVTETVVPTVPKAEATPSYVGKRVEAKVDLRFYSKPSWADKDVVGTVNAGLGFTIVDKLMVGSAYQYKVKNSKGAIYYITASDKYVTVK